MQMSKPSDEVRRHLETLRQIGAAWTVIAEADLQFRSLISRVPFHVQNPAIFADQACHAMRTVIEAGDYLEMTLMRFEEAGEKAKGFAAAGAIDLKESPSMNSGQGGGNEH
jgi:hypothetical protein